MIVDRRMRRQAVYKPEFEDRLFHVVLPLAAYAILALSPFAAPSHTRGALLGLEMRGCRCSSSAFTIPGTASPAMYSSIGGIQKPSGAETSFQRRRGYDAGDGDGGAE